MKINSFVLFTLLIFNFSFGQIKHIVVDVATKERIPFVNIWVENTDIGTISTEDGQFALPKIDGDKIIVFSATGYITKRIEFKLIDNSIELTPQIIELNEVVVDNLKSRNDKKTIDKLKKRKIKHYLPGFGKPWVFGKFFGFKEEYEKTPFLKEISIATETSLTEASFIIRLFKANKEGEPEGYLYDKNIIVTTNKGKRIIDINISDLNLEFPKNGFFLAVEWLLTKENRDVFDSFQPNIGFTHEETNKNSWLYRFGIWNKVKSYNGENYSNNTYKQLAVELKLVN